MTRAMTTCLALLAVLTAGNAHADSIAVNPAVDAQVTDSGFDGTFDVVQDLGIITVDVNLVAQSGPYEQRGVLEFDISAIPAGAVIGDAHLFLTTAGFGPVPLVGIYGYAGDAVVSVADAAAGSLLTSFAPIKMSHALNDIFLPAAFVQQLIDHGDPVAGLVLRELSDRFQTYSNETQDPAFRPLLVVNFKPGVVPPVPEPASLTLLGAAGLLYIGSQRAKQKRRSK